MSKKSPNEGATNSKCEELPLGWMEIDLRECVDVLDNLRVPVNSDERAKRQGEVPYYGATGQVGWIDDALFNEELLLIGEDGAPFFDKSKPIAYIITGGSWVNNHAHVLRTKRGVSSNQYLKLFLDWFDYHEYVNGTTRLKLTQGAMNRIPVRLAPLTEQRRIVAKLERLLGHVDACQGRLAKIPVLLKRFRQAVLAAACSGRLTTDWRGENPTEGQSEAAREALMDADDGAEAKIRDTPDSWAWRSLDRVCLKITDGEHLTPSVTEQGVPLLSAKDVRDDRLDFSDTKFVTGEFAKKSRLRCNPEQGDILVVSRGATVGRTCRVKVANVFCLMGSVLLFKPDPRYILPQMIEFSFKSPSGLAALVSTSSSTAQQAIYIKDMRSFAIPVPPLPEQQEIVRRVESLFALADQIEARLVAAKRQVDALTPSLLARAFAGKLVPQDPGDEPAAKLLERIRKSQPTNPRKGYAPKNG